jgi:hypothetical protein
MFNAKGIPSLEEDLGDISTAAMMRRSHKLTVEIPK